MTNILSFRSHLQFLHMPHWFRLALASSRFLALSLLLAIWTQSWMPDGLVLQTQNSRICTSLIHIFFSLQNFSVFLLFLFCQSCKFVCFTCRIGAASSAIFILFSCLCAICIEKHTTASPVRRHNLHQQKPSRK